MTTWTTSLPLSLIHIWVLVFAAFRRGHGTGHDVCRADGIHHTGHKLSLIHIYERRMEIYTYFEVPEGQVVFHMCGEPTQTRHIVMHNEDAVISPCLLYTSRCV